MAGSQLTNTNRMGKGLDRNFAIIGNANSCVVGRFCNQARLAHIDIKISFEDAQIRLYIPKRGDGDISFIKLLLNARFLWYFFSINKRVNDLRYVQTASHIQGT